MSSQRLIFREFTKKDFDLLYSLFSSEEVMRYTIFDTCVTESELIPFFSEIVLHKRTYGYVFFQREDNGFIGMGIINVALRNEFGGCGEIGCLLMPQYWGKGYATEIANAMLDIGFSDLHLHRICARCNANNTASEKVMKKTGMKKEGELRKVRYKHGGWHNEVVYALLTEDYYSKE